MSQTAEVISQCKARIAAKMHDVKDEVVVALWKSLVDAMELNNRIQKALDEVNKDARQSVFTDDIAATRLAKLTGVTPA